MNSPGTPTRESVTDNQIPRTNGYAMNKPSSTTVGMSSARASQRSSWNGRKRCGGGASPYVETAVLAMGGPLPSTAPPQLSATGRTRRCGGVSLSGRTQAAGLSVDLLQLALGPLHSNLGRGTLHGFRVHVGDDVFGERLGRLLAR